MLFNTVSYLAFLALAVVLYWLLRSRGRVWLLLAASLLFYALWRYEFVLLISFSAFVDYYFSLKIYDEKRPSWRKLWLVCSLSINLGLLAYFKYTYFLLDNVSGLGALLGQDWVVDAGKIILPLGISFYTFLSISYTLDVYRGFFVPVRHFPTYLTYVMFWPHMIAGPILRAHELLPQLTGQGRFDVSRFADGMRRVVFGLFLKVALADQLAPFVDDAFQIAPAHLSALDVWTMSFAFGLQIYFDFCGYSMIAIGSARLLGVEFPENFNWPYLATSPRDFWKRWHITLSSWIRDYLYLPLCGVPVQDRSRGGLEVNVMRPGSVRSSVALFVTWFLMGLWHGAAWRFALWGVWHACFIWLYRLAAPRLAVLPLGVRAIGGWAITLAVSMLAWIPFRAPTLHDSLMLMGRVFDVHAYGSLAFRENFYLIVAVIFAGMLALHFIVRYSARVRSALLRHTVETGALAFAIFVLFIFLRPIGQFIYFQF